MSLNVGHLVGYLELDDKKFNRSADRADKKMTALQLHLKALAATNPKIQVDVETRKLDELKARLVDLKAQAAKGVDVRVEIAQALVEIDRVEAKLRMLHNREIRIDVDNRSALAKLGAVGSKVNGLWASILGLGPMLVPLAAAGAGGVLAIGSASVAAAAGVGVLVTAFAGLNKATDALSKYREAVDQAGPKAKIQSQQLALGVQTAQAAYAKHPTAGNAQKLSIAKQKQAQGPQALISAKNTLDNSAYGDQTKAGKAFAAFTLDKLQPAGHRLHASAQSAVLPGVERGLKSLIPLVPIFDRLITHVGHDLGELAARAGKALNDPFWRHFFQWVAQTAGPTLLVMGHTFGMVFEGIARVLQRFGPQGQSVVHWIDTLATKFNAWSQGGSGSSFQRFMDYVAQAGPAVIGVLKPLGIIIGQLIAGMAQSGLGELHTFGLLLDGIAHLPTGAIQTIGVVLPGIILALKGMQLANAISNISGLSSAFGGLARNAEAAAETGALGSGIRGKTLAKVGGIVAGVSIASSASGIHNKGGQYAANIGGSALAGGSAGALVGSVIPGVGTGVGAAAGTAVGALVGLYKQLHMVDSATRQSADAWKDYAATLDQVTGATTEATRAKALQNASDSGLLKSTRALGINDRQVVNALVDGGKARDQVVAAVKREITATDAAIAAKKRELDANNAIATDMSVPLAQQTAAANKVKANRQELDSLEKLKASQQKDNDLILKGVGAVQKSVAETQRNAAAINDLTGKLHGIPRRIATQIKAEGILPTTKGVITLAEKYRLTPNQIKTVITASGMTLTQRQIDHLITTVVNYGKLHPTPKIDADTSAASAKIQALINAIGAIHDKTVHITTTTNANVAEHASGKRPKALGGPVAAARLYQVGERGPELFVPNVAGRIVSNYDVKAMLSVGTRTGAARPNPSNADAAREIYKGVARALAEMPIVRTSGRLPDDLFVA